MSEVHYLKTGTEHFQRQIDRLISSTREAWITEWYYPPHLATTYLVGTWGYNLPEVHKIDVKRGDITFIFVNPYVKMNVYLTINWKAGFKTGFFIENDLGKWRQEY